MPKIYKDDITYFGFGVGVGGKYLYTRMIAKKLKTEIFFKKKKINQSINQTKNVPTTFKKYLTQYIT